MRDEVMPGRPREFDETVMLRRIMKLFWREGYEGVSLAKIMAETGLKKGSLYAAYGDKRSMYLKALAQHEADIVDSTVGFLRDTSVPPRERLEAFLSAPLNALQNGDRSGCFLCNASADQADVNLDTKGQVQSGFDKLTRGLVAALTDLDAELPPQTVLATAQALLTIYTGLRVRVRTGAAIETLQPIVRISLDLVQTVSSKT